MPSTQAVSFPVTPTQGGSGVANTGNLTWNAAQTLGFTSGQTMTFPAASTTLAGLGTAQTFSAANIFSAAGAASTPGLSITGAPYTGGSTTTNTPQLYINSGAVPTTWPTAGTMFGINTPSGFTGSFLDFHTNGGVTKFNVDSNGSLTVGSSVTLPSTGLFFWSGGAILSNAGSGKLQLGLADGATASAQSLYAQSIATGNSNVAGAPLTVRGSLSTGSGTSGDIIFQTGGTGAAVAVQNTATTALTIKGATQAVVVASGKTFQIGNAATTGLTAGVLAALTNATIVITDSTGQAYRIPCII